MTPGQEALAEAMRIESARIYGRLLGESFPAAPVEQKQPATRIDLTAIPFDRDEDSYYGPAPSEVLAELVEAVAPSYEYVQAADRVKVEQMLGWGHTPAVIAHELGADLAEVLRIQEHLERLGA